MCSKTYLFLFFWGVFGCNDHRDYSREHVAESGIVGSIDGKIERVIISVCHDGSTFSSEPRIFDQTSRYFLDGLGCNCCIVDLTLMDQSIIQSNPNQFVGFHESAARQRINKLSIKFQNLIDTLAFDSASLQIELNQAWKSFINDAIVRGEDDSDSISEYKGEMTAVLTGNLSEPKIHFVKLDTMNLEAFTTVEKLDIKWRLSVANLISTDKYDDLDCYERVSIDYSQISGCESMSDSSCRELVKEKCYYYVQDAITVVENTVVPTIHTNSRHAVFCSYLTNSCGELESVEEGIPIDGGDILISDNYAFIGQNNLEKYLDTMNGGYLEIDLDDSSVDRQSIESQLQKKLKLGEREIIWIGTDNVRPTYDIDYINQYQPFFHIDIFFALADIIPSELGSMKPTFQYILGIPEYKGSTQPLKKHRDAIADLKDWVRECGDEVDSVLSSKYQTHRIEIPLPIRFQSTSAVIRKLQTYPNGIMEVFDNQCTFYLPSGLDGNLDEPGKRAKQAIEDNGISVELVPNSFNNRAAVNCRVQVIQRSN